MKKIILFLLFLLIGGTVLFAFGESIRNEKCLDTDKMVVFQVLNDGILTYLCPTNYPSYYDDSFDACYKGKLVFMAVNPKYNDYVDDQRVTLPSTQCFCNNGTFRYTTKGGLDKTVRKIKIISSAVTNPTK